MTDPRDNTPTVWEKALGRALKEHAGDDSPVLFYEERVDLRVESVSGRSPASVTSYWRGLAARGRGGAGPVAFQADPSPDDAARLVRLASESAPRFPRPSLSEERAAHPPGPLADQELTGVISEVTDLLLRSHPRAEIVGRGVAFEQSVVVARAGDPVVRDLRRGARLRFDCRLPGSAAVAVAELLLPRLSAEGAPRGGRSLKGSLGGPRSSGMRGRPPGRRLPVVLAPGVGGVLVHEIVGHALEADRVLDADSWLGQFEEPVAAHELRVVDDPRRGRAPWRIDDEEGEPSRPTALIRDGRVAGLLHDSRTAKAAGQRPTGHGRCSSYRDPVQPRMGCTFVAPGKLEPAELLRGIRDGVYVRRMEAGTTDPRTGRAVFRVTDADRISGGKIDAPLQPHLLFIEGPRVLAAADRIANDLVFDSCIGSCHRDGRPLSISVGAPTMWIGLAAVFVRDTSARDQR